MSEVEQRRDAGMDARGRATQGAVADVARAARIRRSAWTLAALAASFYLGYIAWMLIKAPL